MYRNTIVATGALVAALPMLAAACVSSRSARMSRWEMPGITDDAGTKDPVAKTDDPKAAESSHKGSAEAPSPNQRGRSLRHLPASCKEMVYVNVKGLGSFGPVSSNESAIRDRAKAILGQYREIEDALRDGLEALHAKGLFWRRDLEEMSVCFEKNQVKVLVVAGTFESSELLGAMREWIKHRGGSADVVDRAGHSYAMLGHYYAAQVGPGMVAVAKEMDVIDEASVEGTGVVARGGQENDLVFVGSKRASGRIVTAGLSPVGDDALVVNTTIERAEGSFDPARDREPMRADIESLAQTFRDSPLATLADDVARTDIVFDGSTARLRTVLAESDLRQGISKAASVGQEGWQTLRDSWMVALGGQAAPKEPAPIKVSTPPAADEPKDEPKAEPKAEPKGEGEGSEPKAPKGEGNEPKEGPQEEPSDKPTEKP